MDLCNDELCTGCAACANSCPNQCIRMLRDEEGFLRPVVDTTNCAACETCQKACPILNPENHSAGTTTAYAAIHKDDAIRRDSTSGGVFSLLCQWVFDHGGVVFGAAYAEDFSVEHRCVRSMEELSDLRTAKYAQSRLGYSYQDVKQLLSAGQYVLFSGTPCQIGGLRAFLGKEYETLVLVDLVCHGVPSPAVWARYLHYRSSADASGAAPTAVNLRSKETGWPGYSVRFDYENGLHYSARNSEDPFMRCFIGNLCLRPSCYACRFKGIARFSDFTLGDYWGVWSQLPEYNDGKGTSLVMIHSERACRLWNQLQTQLQCRPVSLPECLDENPSALASSACPENRSAFMSRYTDEDFQTLAEEFLPQPAAKAAQPSFLRRAAGKLKRLVR